MQIGNKFTIKEKILLVKFSVLNIEMMLNGILNTELRNISKANIFIIDIVFSFKVIIEVNIDRRTTLIVAIAILNEILVNIFRFFLSKKLTSLITSIKYELSSFKLHVYLKILSFNINIKSHNLPLYCLCIQKTNFVLKHIKSTANSQCFFLKF